MNKEILAAAVLSASLLTACGGDPKGASTSDLTPSPTLEPTNTPTIEPTVTIDPTATSTPYFFQTPNPNTTLWEHRLEVQTFPTAQAASDQGKDNTFVPVKPFTQELFDDARKGVITLIITSAHQQAHCTGWIADISPEVMTIITAKHCVEENDNSPTVWFWKPSVEIHDHDVTALDVRIHPDRDIAAIDVETPESLDASYQAPLWIDDAEISPNTPLLQLGYPVAFTQTYNDFPEIGGPGILSASIALSTNVYSDRKFEFFTDGLGPLIGCSGGPVFRFENGKLEVIGLMTGISPKNISDASTQYTIITRLDLESLLGIDK